MLAAAAGSRNAARWTVALALGLRQSEALALQWSDIDLLNGHALACAARLHRVSGKGLVYEAPKTKRSERTLALPTPLVAALHAHKAAQLGERMLAGSEWHDEDLVFAQPNGRPIDKKADYNAWRRLLQRAGVRHVRLHDGRHTAATLLLSEGVHPRVVMELLGHAQMRTTMDIYSHVMPALAREAADRMALSCPEPGEPDATAADTVVIDHRKSNTASRERQTRSFRQGHETVTATKTATTPQKMILQVALGPMKWVELRGLEPLTPTLPVWCATSCATAPYDGRNVTRPATPPKTHPESRQRVVPP